MVYLWGIDSYLNIEQIQIRGIEIMISAYGSLGLFGPRERSKYIEHNTYKGRGINFRSRPTSIHELVHKSLQ